ncbi:hypothetical protein GJU39_20765 [Pedobacter petrophilus]|uniref:Uncharacterized protein n=2 Tax=Pedobacter TaxID=84567 RepID=A0A7K0G567_9SPHI|nr:hypothetical protein [Pedobacter petrophilus]MRX78514.1 hypothetical protein [Pedobacter petrophilus]
MKGIIFDENGQDIIFSLDDCRSSKITEFDWVSFDIELTTFGLRAVDIRELR